MKRLLIVTYIILVIMLCFVFVPHKIYLYSYRNNKYLSHYSVIYEPIWYNSSRSGYKNINVKNVNDLKSSAPREWLISNNIYAKIEREQASFFVLKDEYQKAYLSEFYYKNNMTPLFKNEIKYMQVIIELIGVTLIFTALYLLIIKEDKNVQDTNKM